MARDPKDKKGRPMPEWMNRPHRRQNPLTGEWVLVSPQRAQRPWLGEVEPPPPPPAPAYDPHCYLCPGNERSGGVRNPDYAATFVFDNDFPALLPDDPGPAEAGTDTGLTIASPERGICRVVCFSPRHDLSIPSMDIGALDRVVETWTAQSIELRELPFIRYVQIFENRGPMMGASNPHPHSQIWATEHVPNELVKEDTRQKEHHFKTERCLLCDYLLQETGSGATGDRFICENERFVALVPFWAIWPFEAIVLPKRHFDRLEETTPAEKRSFGEILNAVTKRFDKVFAAPFPYSMGFHERPKEPSAAPEAWHFHVHFYPPLLRSATVRKFMVGFELLAGPQRDITPEMAADRLRRAV